MPLREVFGRHDKPSLFEAPGAEIKQQALTEAGRTQVIENLGHLKIPELRDSLEFDDNGFVANEI